MPKFKRKQLLFLMFCWLNGRIAQAADRAMKAPAATGGGEA
jgi:hypothetical protein